MAFCVCPRSAEWFPGGFGARKPAPTSWDGSYQRAMLPLSLSRQSHMVKENKWIYLGLCCCCLLLRFDFEGAFWTGAATIWDWRDSPSTNDSVIIYYNQCSLLLPFAVSVFSCRDLRPVELHIHTCILYSLRLNVIDWPLSRLSRIEKLLYFQSIAITSHDKKSNDEPQGAM